MSIIIPAREWDPFLLATLSSVSSQALPKGVELEVIVGLARAAPEPLPEGVRVIPNLSGTIPDALNLAIAGSKGELIVRVDARCVVQRDHVARIAEILDDPAIGCVGGAQLVLDRGVFGTAYAVAFNSPLLGPSVYRYGRTSRPVDSPYLGAWRRRDLVELGGFDPRLLRNQDNELADRVRNSGKVVWYDAELVVGYHNARSLRHAIAHHREFGRWRMVQAEQGQRALTGRHLGALAVAAVAAAASAAALAAPRTRRPTAALAGVGYVASVAGGLATAGRLRRARPDISGPGFNPLGVALAPAVAAVIDAAWVAGLVEGRFRQRRDGTTAVS